MTAAATVAVAVAVSKEHQALRCKLNQPFTPLFAVCLLLAGCGGGGDASDPPPLIATPFPEQPATGLSAEQSLHFFVSEILKR